MTGRIAKYVFLVVCVVLAILLLTKTITTMVSAWIFAVALVVLGGMSRGFRKGGASPR